MLKEKLSETYSSSASLPQPEVLSEISLTRNSKNNRPKLSLTWVKEFDGERLRLVGRWIKQD
ncbi:MAG: hypothetical protein JO235_18495 [Chroococcidiopsidaceae cyanobacterium CP_BM_RX_35]|nr:hypothetical protein [Chroococcidiopsidaceae cyanobacterium CP_BM_RX_35]